MSFVEVDTDFPENSDRSLLEVVNRSTLSGRTQLPCLRYAGISEPATGRCGAGVRMSYFIAFLTLRRRWQRVIGSLWLCHREVPERIPDRWPHERLRVQTLGLGVWDDMRAATSMFLNPTILDLKLGC